MHITCRVGQGSPEHNARLFTSDRATFDPERTPKNLYIVSSSERCSREDFKTAVLQEYEKLYGTHLKAQNERHLKSGHKERIKDVETLYKAHKGVSEFLFQVGDKNTHADEKTLWKAWARTMNEIIKLYGKNVKMLDAARHVDEVTPHIHAELAFCSMAKGIATPDKTKALQEMGFKRPDPDKPRGRYNNELMTFTRYVQETFLAKARELGLDVEDIQQNANKHLSTVEYKRQQEEKRLQELQRQTEIEEQKLQSVRRDIEDAKNAAPQSFKDKQRQVQQASELKKTKADLAALQDELKHIEEIAPDVRRQARSDQGRHVQHDRDRRSR